MRNILELVVLILVGLAAFMFIVIEWHPFVSAIT